MSLSVFRPLCAVFFIFLAFLPRVVYCQTFPDQVAKVGNISISNYDLRREMQRILPMNVGFHSSVTEEKVAEIQEKALQNLLEQARKVQYAIAEEISVPSSEVDAQLDKVRKKFASEEEFETALRGEIKEAFRA